MSFQAALQEASTVVQARLVEVIASQAPTPLLEPMLHAVGGGKGLRGFLVMQSAKLHGVDGEGSLQAAAAVELIHAYSLVHDDLPCMDNDEQRRGQPTIHVKWDEAMAVLAGDALQTLAFGLLADEGVGKPATQLELIASLSRSAGARGMVRGQALDVAAEMAEQPLSLDEIVELQEAKTGALFEWSCTAGAILAGADPEPMRRYAHPLGLAFQIADDILDAEGDSALAGKRLRKDSAAGKATFVSLLGLDGAKAHARELVAQAEAALDPFGTNAGMLRQAVRFAVLRQM